jgi:hypothetical protein
MIINMHPKNWYGKLECFNLPSQLLPSLSGVNAIQLLNTHSLLIAASGTAGNCRTSLFWYDSWTNLSQQDKTWAEFSTLDMAVCACCAFSLLRSKTA